ncbi:Six-hairpin glycosidase-like protein [Leucosporidium creatinivorum]|uniref:Six-hairpin glycosidase-like protein n=1 Tax=Leucosporidium creatinivorum TaxID=106004 RepID=A0A1Y2FEQ2_9BASI|nr:Six-hairpin glycosidase-like protein [Leucosporidium creatinivorum]
MIYTRVALLVALGGIFGAQASPLQARNNDKSSTPWPAIPTPESYQQPSGPVYVYPVSVAKGLTSNHSSSASSPTMIFDSVGDIYTLDYGADVAGRPVFGIAELSNSYAQIAIKYSEAYNGLKQNFSDGPYSFANGLSNEFRVETLNITKTGELSSFLVQGSQRWQSIELIKGSGVTLKSAGFISTVDQAPLASKPGYFASSNSTFTDIWNLGPRTQQLACYSPDTQISTWEIDSQKGAYIRGQKPATTIKGANAQNYTLSFETMIDYGGVGWRLDTEVDNIWAEGPILVLSSNYPEGSFVNYNTSLLPPNTLVLGRGWALQNQTTLSGWHLDSFPVPFDVTEKEWHEIATESPGDGTYTVKIDGKQIASFNLTAYGQGARPVYFPPAAYYSFALGPWQDQAAWYRNVNVTLASGASWYSNPMTSEDVKIEYGVAPNDYYVCSDAGKRDRFAWLGDRQISARAIEAVGDFDAVSGPAEQAFARQVSTGGVPANTLFSELDPLGVLGRTENLDLILVDWLNRFTDVIYQYWIRSGNDTFIGHYWPQMLSMTAYTIQASLDPKTNFGTNGGSGTLLRSTVHIIQSLEEMVIMGEYLGHNASVASLATQAQLSRKAVENSWNATGGFYALPGAQWTLIDLAMIEINKIGSQERRDEAWSGLSSRIRPGGYVDPPIQDNFNLLDTGLHPVDVNVMGYLLWAAGERRDGAFAQDLITRTYGPMVERGVNYTGGYWEFLSSDGTYPGNDLQTALSHFWGGFPTAFLSEYVLGVQPITPGFKTFRVAPLSDWSGDWVHGRVPTPHGLIYVAWGYDANGKISMEITAPQGTTGYVSPPFSGSYSANGKTGQMGELVVKGGEGKVMIVQE